MENITMTMTPTIQWIDVRLGMPVCGHAFRPSTVPSGAFTTKGHLGLATDAAYVPGILAWSPPLC